MARPVTSRDGLRQAIDRGVAVARMASVLGCMGRIAAVAAAASAALLIVIRVMPLAGGPTLADRWIVVAAAAAAALASWPLIQTTAQSWPSRLAIAVAAEQAHPQLGERISRAVEFLDDGQSAAVPGRGSAALRALAVEQAAEAAAGIGSLPVPGLRRQVWFAAAGGAAVAVMAAATSATNPARTTAERGGGPMATTNERVATETRSIPASTMAIWQRIESIRGRLAGGTPPAHAAVVAALAAVAAESREALAAGSEGDGGVLAVFADRLSQLERDLAAGADTLSAVRQSLDELSALARAAARIADAAAFEHRLAGLLSEWFALAPGEAPPDLPAPFRTGLDQAASLEDQCVREIAADRKTLLVASQRRPSESKGIAQAAALLASIDGTTSAGTADAIRGNRLAIATESARHAADLLERATVLLGMTGTGASAGQALHPARDVASTPSSMHLAHVLLDRIPDAIASGPDAGPASTATAIMVPGTEQPTAAGPTAGQRPGIGESTATPSPRSGTMTGPRVAAEPSPAEYGIDRAWLLLQEQSFTQRPQSDEPLAFPSHRQAIGAYYRLLLESARGRKHPSSQP